VAGPLISSSPAADLGDPPIVKIDTPDQSGEFVRKLAGQKADLVKIWYIAGKDHPVDALERSRATIEEVTRNKFASRCTQRTEIARAVLVKATFSSTVFTTSRLMTRL
jgi:hypothetical protein